jgi:anti-anti-sigma regulatory factor
VTSGPMTGSGWGLRVRAEGDVVVFELLGDVCAEVIRHLLELAARAEEHSLSVEIDLGGVDTLSEEGAALLLFEWASRHGLPTGVTLRTTSRQGRQAVLRAYARRRVRRAEVP